MIPTILVPAVVAGLFKRGWWIIPVAAVAWPAILFADDVIESGSVLVTAAFGVLNASFGILVGRIIRDILGRKRPDQEVLEP